MSPLDLQSEFYPPTGGLSGDGARNQLGRPRLDRLAVLVREAVQNSWDARAALPIRFETACWTLSAAEQRFLREQVLPGNPSGLGLPAALAAEPSLMLALSDRSTVGLGGPTRADVAAPPGEPANFVNFLRNVGHPPERALGGGTYGFGKAAYYVASRVRTICVYTRCLLPDGGIGETRFMAAALGSEFSAEQDGQLRRFTGRHWWGRRTGDGFVDPLIGAEADRAAAGLGLPQFADGETGTTILIIAPDLETHDARALVEAAAERVLEHCWPKLVDGPEGGPSVLFEFRAEGQVIALPAPGAHPRVAAFARVFAAARSAAAAEQSPIFVLSDIESVRWRRRLGRFAAATFPRPLAADVEERPGPILGPSRHAALIRGPGLVVRYIEGPALPSDLAEYAAVFAVDAGVDDAFARAEPPTHDDWTPDMLESDMEKTLVRTAMRDIPAALRAFTSGRAENAAPGEDVPLGEFADQLGGLIAGVAGPGAGVQPAGGVGGGGAGGGGGRPRAPALRVGQGEVCEAAGRPAVSVSFEVDHHGAAEAVVEALVGVMVDGGALEADPPAGAAQPEVLEWRGPGGLTVPGTTRLRIPASQAGQWYVVVGIPSDAATAVDLRLAPAGAA